ALIQRPFELFNLLLSLAQVRSSRLDFSQLRSQRLALHRQLASLLVEQRLGIVDLALSLFCFAPPRLEFRFALLEPRLPLAAARIPLLNRRLKRRQRGFPLRQLGSRSCQFVFPLWERREFLSVLVNLALEGIRFLIQQS